ncbi:MAG TPA: AAA family ATPase [Armatimonadota bacterium]|nr:AAA family ATPase [Armatimonadota bacterium]
MKNDEQVLLPQHQRLIDESGVSKEVANTRGYRSVTDKGEVRRLGFADRQCRVPALVIPVWGVDGKIRSHQIRPDSPRKDGKGKEVKYETPAKSRMALDVHLSIRKKIGNPKIPLFITEGVRKADAAISRGLCCIALLGVWNWRGTNADGGKVALPDWEAIALEGRLIFIAFDSDVMRKPEVQKATMRLKAFLEYRGAKVQLIHLPPGEGGAKNGLDDYLAAGHSVEELLALVSEVTEHGPSEQLPEDLREEFKPLVVLTHSELVQGELPDVSWTVLNLVPTGGISMISGDSGVGKSWLMLHLAQCVASGMAFLGTFPVTPCGVLVLDAETGPSLLERRVKKLFSGLQAENSDNEMPADLPVSIMPTAMRFKPETVNQFADYLKREGIALVIADPLINYCGMEENSAEGMAAFFEIIRSITQEAGCTFIFTHHSRKESRLASNAPGQMLRGSSAIRAILDSHLFIRKLKGGRLLVEHDKCRCAEPIAPFIIAVEDTDTQTTVCRYIGEAEENCEKAALAQDCVLRTLADGGGAMARKGIIEQGKADGVSERTVTDALARLLRAGEITKRRAGNSIVYELAKINDQLFEQGE